MAKKKSENPFALDLSLDPKEERFCREYVVNLSVLDACKAVGISYSSGLGWLNRPACASFIRSLIYERNIRTKVDADALLTHLDRMRVADIADIMLEDGSDFKPLNEWPQIWRQMVSGRKVDKDGNVSYTFIDRAKVLEMVGKHTDVAAWTAKLEVQFSMVDEMEKARKRAIEMRREPDLKLVKGEVVSVSEETGVPSGLEQAAGDRAPAG